MLLLILASPAWGADDVPSAISTLNTACFELVKLALSQVQLSDDRVNRYRLNVAETIYRVFPRYSYPCPLPETYLERVSSPTYGQLILHRWVINGIPMIYVTRGQALMARR